MFRRERFIWSYVVKPGGEIIPTETAQGHHAWHDASGRIFEVHV